MALELDLKSCYRYGYDPRNSFDSIPLRAWMLERNRNRSEARANWELALPSLLKRQAE